MTLPEELMKPDYPFLQDRFLAALEDSNSVCEKTGWKPMHLNFTSTTGKPVFMPLYEKTHSWGEYVFDWAWAEAYQRYGLQYYPKLITAIPFTPCGGPRIRSEQSLDEPLVNQAVKQALDLANTGDYSSWHILFPDEPCLTWLLKQPGLIHRTGVQYHWYNKGYQEFGDFLSRLKSRKRKMLRRERQSVIQAGLDVRMLVGDDIDPDTWSFFYQLYVNTYIKRSGSSGYLTHDFFQQIGSKMADQVAMAVAYNNKELVAAALYLFDQDTLYGRYWGSHGNYEHLHFELCYYQGIEFAINWGLQRFDAGAQGEHKILRGFEPVLTHSLHWIRHPALGRAIDDFVKREHQHHLSYVEQAEELLPYKDSKPEVS